MSVNFFLEAISKMHFTPNGRVAIMFRMLEPKQVARTPVAPLAGSDLRGFRFYGWTGKPANWHNLFCPWTPMRRGT